MQLILQRCTESLKIISMVSRAYWPKTRCGSYCKFIFIYSFSHENYCHLNVSNKYSAQCALLIASLAVWYSLLE